MLDTLFGTPDIYFTIPAALGTTFFLVKLALLLIGAGHDAAHDMGGHDVPHDIHTDAPTDTGLDHTDSSTIFKYLSFQAILTFMMGFGWGGLIVLNATPFGLVGAIVGACTFGGFSAWLLAFLLNQISKLHASGNVALHQSLFNEGVVYVAIPAVGTGQVRLVVDGRQRIYNASAPNGPIASQTKVRVVNFDKARNMLVVEPVTPDNADSQHASDAARDARAGVQSSDSEHTPHSRGGVRI